MKYIIIAAALISALFLYLLYSAEPHTAIFPKSQEQTKPTPQPQSNKSVSTITNNGNVYAYYAFSVQQPQNVALILNENGSISFQELIQQHSCSEAINAGFYDTDNVPLGLFKTTEAIIHGKIQSTLLDGFLWIDRNTEVHITAAGPESSARIALQNGPLLLISGQPRTLKIQNDEMARRSFAAVTDDNVLWFGIITASDNTYSGPLLADLPDILLRLSSDLDVRWNTAINLDGGSASAFSAKGTVIQELTPVGGIFCVRK